MTRRLTKRDLARLSEEYRLYNKQMKQSNNRKLCFASLEDYLDWRFGRTTASSPVRSSTRTMQPTRSYERATRAQEIPSLLHKELPSDLKNATAKPDGNSYSGTYIRGIAQMHKSNAVPVGSGDNPEDYATMRRSN
jgi:hypothetical protein